jgi:hypothetical protein
MRLFLITQAKSITASVAYFYPRLADVAFAGVAHPNVYGQLHFAAPAWLFSWLRKPNRVSRFRRPHFPSPILTHQIFSSFMLLIRPRNASTTCGCAQLVLCLLSRCRRSRQVRALLRAMRNSGKQTIKQFHDYC